MMEDARAKALLIYGSENAMDAINIYKDGLNGIAVDVDYLNEMLTFFKENNLIDSYMINTEWIDKSTGHRNVKIEVNV